MFTKLVRSGVCGLVIGQVFCASTVGSAAPYHSHPRLWVMAEDVPRLRAMAVDKTNCALGYVPADVFQEIKKRADDYTTKSKFTFSVIMPGIRGGPAKEWSYTLSDEAPPRHDDYPHYPCWTPLSRQIEAEILHLCFAFLVTQERRYFDKAKEMVLHLCRWPITWTDPSYGSPGACLDTSHLASAVAVFYDWSYDLLSPQERAAVREALVDKALIPLNAAIPRYGAVGWPNGFAVLTKGLGLGAIALLGEEARAGEWLALAIRYAKEFFDTQGKDGGCMEGPMYGTYGTDWLADFIWALQTAQIENDLLQHRFFATLPQYAISQMCPNDKRHAGFGDGDLEQPFPVSMTLLALQGNAEAA